MNKSTIMPIFLSKTYKKALTIIFFFTTKKWTCLKFFKCLFLFELLFLLLFYEYTLILTYCTGEETKSSVETCSILEPVNHNIIVESVHQQCIDNVTINECCLYPHIMTEDLSNYLTNTLEKESLDFFKKNYFNIKNFKNTIVWQNQIDYYLDNFIKLNRVIDNELILLKKEKVDNLLSKTLQNHPIIIKRTDNTHLIEQQITLLKKTFLKEKIKNFFLTKYENILTNTTFSNNFENNYKIMVDTYLRFFILIKKSLESSIPVCPNSNEDMICLERDIIKRKMLFQSILANTDPIVLYSKIFNKITVSNTDISNNSINNIIKTNLSITLDDVAFNINDYSKYKIIPFNAFSKKAFTYLAESHCYEYGSINKLQKSPLFLHDYSVISFIDKKITTPLLNLSDFQNYCKSIFPRNENGDIIDIDSSYTLISHQKIMDIGLTRNLIYLLEEYFQLILEPIDNNRIYYDFDKQQWIISETEECANLFFTVKGFIGSRISDVLTQIHFIKEKDTFNTSSTLYNIEYTRLPHQKYLNMALQKDITSFSNSIFDVNLFIGPNMLSTLVNTTGNALVESNSLYNLLYFYNELNKGDGVGVQDINLYNLKRNPYGFSILSLFNNIKDLVHLDSITSFLLTNNDNDISEVLGPITNNISFKKEIDTLNHINYKNYSSTNFLNNLNKNFSSFCNHTSNTLSINQLLKATSINHYLIDEKIINNNNYYIVGSFHQLIDIPSLIEVSNEVSVYNEISSNKNLSIEEDIPKKNIPEKGYIKSLKNFFFNSFYFIKNNLLFKTTTFFSNVVSFLKKFF